MSEKESRNHTFDRAGDREEAFETRVFDSARQSSATNLRQRTRGPFGGTGATPRGQDPAFRQPLPPEEVVWTPAARSSRADFTLSPRLFAVIAVIAILVVGGLAYLLLGSSDTPPPSPPATTPPATGGAPASPPAGTPPAAGAPAANPPAAGALPSDHPGASDAAELERLRQDNQRLQNTLRGMNDPAARPGATQPATPPASSNATPGASPGTAPGGGEDPATLDHGMPVPTPRPTHP